MLAVCNNAGFHEWPTSPFMEPCGGPLIATTSFFVFEASNVPLKLETEKNGTVNCRVGTLLPCIQSVTGGMCETSGECSLGQNIPYNPKHLYPKLNGYRDNGRRSLKL